MKGRPILGAVSGFFFGLFLGITLFLVGVIPLHSDALIALPIIGVVLGLVMAWWAPFGKSPDEPPPATSAPPDSMDEPGSDEPQPDTSPPPDSMDEPGSAD